MKSSAKLTAVSLLAAGALGVAIISACTVTSGTNTNTDGGPLTGTSSGDTPIDQGQPDGAQPPAAACTTNTKQDKSKPVRSAGCQACVESKCCTQLTNCFNIDAGAGQINCFDYGECLDNCHDTDGGASCESDCDTATGGNGVDTAYGTMVDCINGSETAQPGPTNCQAECF